MASKFRPREGFGCFQARSFATSSGEMAWLSTSLARRHSRKRLISRVPFHSGRDCHEPFAVFAPSVVSRWTCGCHWTRSPAVAIETTTPGRASSPRPRRTSSLTASAAARPSSVSSSRRLRNSERSSRGMVRTTWVAVGDLGEHFLAQPLGPQASSACWSSTSTSAPAVRPSSRAVWTGGRARGGGRVDPRMDPMNREAGPVKNGNPRGDPSKAPRCGARTRRGTACRCPAMRRRRRCRLHGGKSRQLPREAEPGRRGGTCVSLLARTLLKQPRCAYPARRPGESTHLCTKREG